MYLQHLHGLSDDAVVARWLKNPYFQHFTGETLFQYQPPINPLFLSRWRDLIAFEVAEWLLSKMIEAWRSSGAMKDGRLSRVSVDITVMENNVAYPTDARRCTALRESPIEDRCSGTGSGNKLRQTYARKAPLLAAAS